MGKYELRVIRNRTLEIGGAEKITCVDAEFLTFSVRVPCIGLDPGDRNMGVAVITPGRAIHAYQVRLEDASDAVERIIHTVSVVRGLFTDFLERPELATVERAAFNKIYGQVALAENRSAAIQAMLMENVYRIEVPAPGSIRKTVFGSAKIKGETVWPELGDDGSSALACALYALLTRNENAE